MCNSRRVYLTLSICCVLIGCGFDSSSAPQSSNDPPVVPADDIESYLAAYGPIGEYEDDLEEPPDNPDPDLSQYGLLIGCSKYDFLESADLTGPDNDTALMRHLLLTKFNFAKKNITVLGEQSGESSLRPLFGHIKREFESLQDRVKPGDQVVILFSGHGSQLPDNDPENPDDPEPDGLDEILCPADMKAEFDYETYSIPNALRDDQMREWLGAIRANGASVVVIIDACHSGSAVRGNQVTRQILPEVLVPHEALQAAVDRASQTRGVNENASTFELPDSDGANDGQTDESERGGMTAIYAAQPHEPTIELPLPNDEIGAPMRGLLTYTLVKTITESTGPLNYLELVRRVHDQYVYELGLNGPKPLVEGSGRNNEVFGRGVVANRSPFLLEDRLSSYHINAGKLHGISPGTIFAVYAPVGTEQPSEPSGHVRVLKTSLNESRVVPCEFGEAPREEMLPNSSICKVAQIDYGKFQLQVSFEGDDDSFRAKLAEAFAAEGSLVEFVEKSKQAEWLIRVNDEGQLLLVPSEGWIESIDDAGTSFGPIPQEGESVEWLRERLTRIARAKTLLRVSGASRTQRQRGWLSDLLRGNKTSVRAELLRLGDQDDNEGVPVESEDAKVALTSGDLIAIRVTNESKHAIDFSLLFIDSGFGIDPIFPAPGRVVDNRLNPDVSFTVGPMQIEGTSFGLEHVVVIATKAEGQPADFSWLAQDSIERVANTRSASVQGPLGQLFESAMFGANTTRGLKMADVDDTYVNVISWQTIRSEER